MTYAEKYNYWDMLADYDMQSTKILLDAGRWLHVASLAYSAVLRELKGTLVYLTEKEAPKSDNILFLMNRIAADEAFISTEQGKRYLGEKDEYLDHAIDLTYYHVNDYPFTYKKVLDRFIDEKTAYTVYTTATKLISWLKTFSPPKES